jgi:hypothetical protein
MTPSIAEVMREIDATALEELRRRMESKASDAGKAHRDARRAARDVSLAAD